MDIYLFKKVYPSGKLLIPRAAAVFVFFGRKIPRTPPKHPSTFDIGLTIALPFLIEILLAATNDFSMKPAEQIEVTLDAKSQITTIKKCSNVQEQLETFKSLQTIMPKKFMLIKQRVLHNQAFDMPPDITVITPSRPQLDTSASNLTGSAVKMKR